MGIINKSKMKFAAAALVALVSAQAPPPVPAPAPVEPMPVPAPAPVEPMGEKNQNPLLVNVVGQSNNTRPGHLRVNANVARYAQAIQSDQAWFETEGSSPAA